MNFSCQRLSVLKLILYLYHSIIKCFTTPVYTKSKIMLKNGSHTYVVCELHMTERLNSITHRLQQETVSVLQRERCVW